MKSLAHRIAHNGVLRDADAAGWVVRLARTLEPVHGFGVAHGRVSPEVILTEETSPTSPGRIATPRQVRVFPQYHSPERTLGEGPSPEDDTWASAVTLYVAIAGAVPFPGATDAEVRMSIVGPPPKPLAAFGLRDPRLQAIFDRAFSRDVLERITSIAELCELLEQWSADAGIRALPALDHEGSLLIALRPTSTPNTPVAPAPQAAALVARRAIHEEDNEDDAPTQVRDASGLLADLASLRQPETPVTGLEATVALSSAEATNRPKIQDLAAAPLAAAAAAAASGRASDPLIAAHVAPRAPEVGPTSARLIPFDRESFPGVERAPAGAAPAHAAPAPAHAASAPVQRMPSAPAVASAAASAPAMAPAIAEPPRSAVPVVTASRRSPGWIFAVPIVALGAAAAAWFALRATSGADPGVAGSGTGALAATTPAGPRAPATIGAASTTASLAGTGTGAGTSSLTAPAEPDPSTTPTGTLSLTASLGPTAMPTSTLSLTASVTASAVVSAQPLVSATATATAAPTAVAAASGDVAACLMPLFAEGTFAGPPTALNDICSISDPRKGVTKIKTELVKEAQSRPLSDGMREWAIIGWYGMVAFAALRDTCCSSPPAMDIPIQLGACDLKGTLADVTATITNKTADDADVTAKLKAYTKAAQCVAIAGAHDPFNLKGPIQEGELVTVQKTIARVRAAIKAR